MNEKSGVATIGLTIEDKRFIKWLWQWVRVQSMQQSTSTRCFVIQS